jgi:OOP family OmpA-OmpF porin
MRGMLLAGACALGLVSVPAMAVAQTAPSVPSLQYYVSLGAGFNFGQDDITVIGDPGSNASNETRTTSFDNGYTFVGAFGIVLPEIARLELEGSWRSNQVDRLTVSNEGSVSTGGSLQTFALMLNAFKDFEVAERVSVNVGGGIGVAFVDLDLDRLVGPDASPASAQHPVSDSATVFAWQLGAGAAYKLENGMSITLDYRLFGTADPGFETSNGLPFDHDNLTHKVMVGLRIPIN